MQVNQALPFMPFSSTARWEVLVGLRNLFRDPNDAGSIYDELLVVRPPKRVIGGVLDPFLSFAPARSFASIIWMTSPVRWNRHDFAIAES